jgi:hypothetical protein
MSTDFIRRFRANAKYASLPPRQPLIGRALAPKSIPPTRPSSTLAALQAGYAASKRAKRKAPSTPASRVASNTQHFDVALIPIPVSLF